MAEERVCVGCDSNHTQNAGKYPLWLRVYDEFGNIIGFLCKNCYAASVIAPIRQQSGYKTEENSRRITFKGRRIVLPRSPRVGVCNFCRAVKGEIDSQRDISCDKTEMHHTAYHNDDPLRDAIEICTTCHVQESIMMDQITGRPRWGRVIE